MAPDKNLFTSAGLHITCHPVKPGIKRTLRWANAPHSAWGKDFPMLCVAIQNKSINVCLIVWFQGKNAGHIIPISLCLLDIPSHPSTSSPSLTHNKLSKRPLRTIQCVLHGEASRLRRWKVSTNNEPFMPQSLMLNALIAAQLERRSVQSC